MKILPVCNGIPRLQPCGGINAATKNKRTDEINEETDKSNPEEFKDITDEAIDNTWYVKMLKAMVPKEEKEAKKK